MPSWLKKTLPPVVFGLLVILGWELLTIVTNADPRIYPAPSEIAVALFKNPGSLLSNARITTLEMVLGFALGAVVGISIGILLAYSKVVRSAVYPWLIVSQTIPIPAVAAVLVIWFGFSMLPKVLVVVLIAFFPIAVSTVDGLKAVDPEMVRLMRTFGSSRARIFREVRIPVALPHIFTGMKVAAAFSVLGAVFGEWVGAKGGLGYLLLLKNRAVNTDEVFAIIFALSVLGVGFFSLIVLIERITIPWYHKARQMEGAQ
ncbi:MAG: ABC transporter permease subunit [Gammaproteobacteria bacterium]|nr:ABC transporter permease subunit [Gammaproteobacteria bacterium]